MWFAVSVSLTVLMTGCVAVPVSVGESHPFSASRLAFLKTGETTSAEVEAEFGPALRPGHGHWMLYVATQKGSKWLIAAGAGPYAAVGTVGGKTTMHKLIVHLDTTDRVLDYGVVSGQDTCDPQRALCYAGGMVQFLRDTEFDRSAKQFIPPEVGCAVYMYNADASDTPSVGFFLDGKWIGTVHFPHAYIRTIVAPGEHRLSDDRLSTAVSAAFRCETADLVFASRAWPDFEILSAHEGREAIKGRRITFSIDE